MLKVRDKSTARRWKDAKIVPHAFVAEMAMAVAEAIAAIVAMFAVREGNGEGQSGKSAKYSVVEL